jgi:phosphonate transport system ATP-binding protein
MTQSLSLHAAAIFAAGAIPQPILRTESLAVSYANDIVALKPASLAFEEGSFVVLLGASGAGKSTLLRSLNGLVKPSAGRVIAESIGDLHERQTLRRHRRQTGMIFQQHHLIGRLSVLSNVLLGRLGYHSAARSFFGWSLREKEMALAAIERVGLLEYALQRADQLSGGQQQRVGVARALIQKPRILLADEPIASLDPETASRLLTLIHNICKSDGLSAVVSLHQVEFARMFADRIIGLKGGEIVFDGLPEQLTAPIADSLYKSSASSSSSVTKKSNPLTRLTTMGTVT